MKEAWVTQHRSIALHVNAQATATYPLSLYDQATGTYPLDVCTGVGHSALWCIAMYNVVRLAMYNVVYPYAQAWITQHCSVVVHPTDPFPEG